jgi:hypothetical protein
MGYEIRRCRPPLCLVLRGRKVAHRYTVRVWLGSPGFRYLFGGLPLAAKVCRTSCAPYNGSCEKREGTVNFSQNGGASA